MHSRPTRFTSLAYVAVLLSACSGTDPLPSGQGGGGGSAGSHAASAAVGDGGDSSAAGASGAADFSDAGPSSQAAAGDLGASGASGASGDPGAAGASAGSSNGGASGAASSGAPSAGDEGRAGGGAGGTSAGGASGESAGVGNAAGAVSDPKTGLMIPCVVQSAYTVCRTCHKDPPTNSAPFALVTLTQVQAYAALEINDVTAGIMPLNDMLLEVDKQTMLEWLKAGAQGVPLAACP